jgi:S1-C subfamily serine protease
VNEALTLTIVGGLLGCALVAFVHEIFRNSDSATSRSYWWGYFVGYSSIAMGVTGCLASAALISDAWPNWRAMESGLLACAWSLAMTASGVGVLLRRRWAWITRICLWPNIITIVINIIYYKHRREEFQAEALKRLKAKSEMEAGEKRIPETRRSAERELIGKKLGISSLWVTGGGVALLFATMIGGVMMLSADPAALADDSPETILAGLAMLAVGVLLTSGVALAIASLVRRERRRWPAVTALGITTVSCAFIAAATIVEDAPQPNAEASGMTAGTGFFVTNNGYLITCRHVIDNGGTLTIVTANGSAPAKVVAVHNLLDLALLKVDAQVQVACLPISKSSDLPLGAAVTTLGFPNVEIQGFEPKLAKGHVAALSGPQDDPAYMQLGMSIAPGYSGAAVIDDKGNAVGVATMILDAKVAANVSYATKGELVFLFLMQTARQLDLTDLTPPRPMTKERETDMQRVRDATVFVISDAEA